MKTVYGVFDRRDQAKRAMDEFARAGMSASTIPRGDGMRSALIRCGVPRNELDQYADAIGRGDVFEAVVVDDDREADARAIMDRYASPSAALEDIVVPVIREELHVGTREVDAGGVRVSSHVREIPVEQTITVREERVTIERRVIDRPIGDGDEAFRERSFDLKESHEEPVVTKRAHVVEEIRIHKDRNERVQTVNDTLRHTDVQLRDLPGERAFDASAYREHFAKAYGNGSKLETFAPAYEFGERLSRRNPASEWKTLEGEARSAWEQRNPGTWDKFKDAVFAGWQRLRRH